MNLTPEQMQQYAAALQRSKKIRRTATVGTVDGGFSAFFAVCAILFTCAGWENLVIGIALAVISYQAFRGARQVRQLNPQGPVTLALNQLVLATLLIMYFSYALWGLSQGKSAILGSLSPGDKAELDQLKSLGVSVDDYSGTMVSAMRIGYIAMIVGTVLMQGLTALYYYRRKALIETYVRETPRWITDLQSVAAGKPIPPPLPPPDA